jgi:hypothetical protein
LYRSAPGDDDASMPGRRVIAELDDVDWLTARREQGWSGRRIATTVGVNPGRVREGLREAGFRPVSHRHR